MFCRGNSQASTSPLRAVGSSPAPQTAIHQLIKFGIQLRPIQKCQSKPESSINHLDPCLTKWKALYEQ